MAVRILSNDLVNTGLEALLQPHTAEGAELVPVADKHHLGTGVTGLAGTLRIRAIPVPDIMALDVCWHSGDEDILMRDEVPSQNINIQFQIGGELQSDFKGLGHPLDMAPGRHNLIFVPEGSDEARVKRQCCVEMLHISVDRDHFAHLIGGGNAWSDRALRDLEAGRPFSGVHGTGAVTPAMMQLVQDIRQPPAAESSPMRRLQVHARMLDLLSLQLGQFVAADDLRSSRRRLSPDDAERLHRLRDHLNHHFLEEHSLAGLAQRFLLNEFKLKSGFRQLFGNSVFGYLKELRMVHAARLLHDCRQTVEEVAFTLGYEYAHHFSTAFKKHYGTSPGQWAGLARPA